MNGAAASPPLHDSLSAMRIAPPTEATLFRVLRFQRATPDLTQVHRALGFQPDRPAHRRWLELTAELERRLSPRMRPRCLFRIDPVRRLEKRRLLLESGAEFQGAIAEFLAGSTYVATFIATVGSAVERISRAWLRAGFVMRGAIADAIASEAAETTAQLCQDEVAAWGRPRGLSVTPRYSPGYCGMSVRQQIPLFASLPAARIGVRLTPSCLMTPIKSVSGLIGLGPPDVVAPEQYPCSFCDCPHCMQRRAPLKLELGRRFDWRGSGE